MKLHFGKYKDHDLADVPKEYLDWVIKNLTGLKRDVRTEIEHEILKRESQLDILNTYYTQEAEDLGITGQEASWVWIDPYRDYMIQMKLF